MIRPKSATVPADAFTAAAAERRSARVGYSGSVARALWVATVTRPPIQPTSVQRSRRNPVPTSSGVPLNVSITAPNSTVGRST